MPHRLPIVALLAITACGRTDFFDDPQAPLDDPAEAPVFEEPRTIFVADEVSGCPGPGTEADLVPRAGERLVVATVRLLGECSGAGGHWMVGRPDGEPRHLMFGGHACWFIDPPPPEGAGPAAPTAVVVARFRPVAAVLEGPRGWCIQDDDGGEPVTSDGVVVALATFATEAGARGAVARWSRR